MSIKIKENKGKLLKILAFLLFIGIVGEAIMMIKISFNDLKEYKEVKETQDQIIEEVVENSKNYEEDTKGVKKEKKPFSIDWNKLNKINKDVIAWIRIPNTSISYPIVQVQYDNSKYIHKNIYGKYSKGGTIFVDGNIVNPFNCANTIIYGHNLANNRMFSQLKKFSNSNFAKNNHIYIYFPSGEIKEYKVISFHSSIKSDDRNIYNPYVDDITEYKSQLLKSTKWSSKDLIEEININDEIITLSTCTNRDKNTRYVLHAVYVS